MKRIVLLLVLVCGCAPSMDELMQEHRVAEAAGKALMKYHVGELVNIKLGGQGMVVNISSFRENYLVRTGPAGHYACRWFGEFELEKP